MNPTTPTPEERTLAAGGNPSKRQTFTHPVHGELTFTWRLPLATDTLRHSIEVDNMLGDLVGPRGGHTHVLASAIAAMTVPEDAPAGKGLLIDLPVVDERVDETEAGERRTRVYYDPATEPNTEWLTDVWLAFFTWRQKLLSDATVRAVGESSGGPSTSSGASSAPSAETTAPPSPTPAS